MITFLSLSWYHRFLSARCKYYFDSMLAQRGYSGSMIFDHKNETLSISVSVFSFISKRPLQPQIYIKVPKGF